MKIFVSYSRRDAGDFANQIQRHLSSFKYDIFTDVDSIRAGEVWSNTIEKNISSCDIFVLIVSHSAIRRPEVKKELELADNMKKRIIPCVNKRYVNYEDLPDNIRKYNGINFERLDDLIQELDYKIELEKKDQGKTASSSPISENQASININSTQSLLERAKGLEEIGQYSKALKVYDEAIKINHNNFDAYYYKGLLFCNIKDFSKALEAIEQAIDIEPKHTDVWYYKGIILEKTERYEEALETFTTDLYIEDKNVKKYIRL